MLFAHELDVGTKISVGFRVLGEGVAGINSGPYVYGNISQCVARRFATNDSGCINHSTHHSPAETSLNSPSNVCEILFKSGWM